MSNAIFGEKKNGVHYTNRYGVYAVIPDEKLEKIVLVQEAGQKLASHNKKTSSSNQELLVFHFMLYNYNNHKTTRKA